MLYFSGQIEPHVCFSKLFWKCNFSGNVISPAYRSDQCIAVLVSFLGGKYFSMRVLLFQQMQVNPYFEETLLPHSLTWFDETPMVTVRRRSEGQPRSQDPVHPPRLARTDTLPPHDTEKSSLAWMQLCFMMVISLIFLLIFLLLFCPLPLVLSEHFLGQSMIFFISTAPGSAAPKPP